MKQFPENFYFGTATSAHQIEGNNIHNDWWRAEQVGKVSHKSGSASDSYNRYEEDFDLAKQMHTNAHRFSIEWSRIEPEEGKFNEREIEHYDKVIRALRVRGIEPFVTLHHFTNPTWFADKGGWGNKKAPVYFERYTRFVVERLGKDVQYWMTINEPLIANSAGYLSGRWPPFRKYDVLGLLRANFHMAAAHRRAYTAIHRLVPNAMVGIAKNNNHQLFFLGSYIKNLWFLNRIKNHQDFIGLNYYSDTKGIYHTVRELDKRYKKPIYITENGISDADDDQRSKYIKDSLRWLQRAMDEGVDVQGYFYWSLLDNFEWAEGFTQKFGLVGVDFDTQKRTPRSSAKIYGKLISNYK